MSIKNILIFVYFSIDFILILVYYITIEKEIKKAGAATKQTTGTNQKERMPVLYHRQKEKHNEENRKYGNHSKKMVSENRWEHIPHR